MTKFSDWLETAEAADDYAYTQEEIAEIDNAAAGNLVMRIYTKGQGWKAIKLDMTGLRLFEHESSMARHAGMIQ